TLQAAVLLVKLPHLDSMVEERQAIASRYRAGLRGTPAIVAEDPPYVRNAYRNFVIRVKDRDAIRRALFEAGIPTGTHYIPPAHTQPAFQDLGYPKGSLPETERAADELLTLPIYPGMPIDDVDLVIEQLRRAMSTAL
ncbi:MAG: DegT/DnrJ/EryC1/StrS family aminotransferase, partial [bacterium]